MGRTPVRPNQNISNGRIYFGKSPLSSITNFLQRNLGNQKRRPTIQNESPIGLNVPGRTLTSSAILIFSLAELVFAKKRAVALRLHVFPVFQELAITEITRGKVKDFLLSKLNDGYSPNTVCHMKDTISGVLNKALDDEIIVANPAFGLKMKNALNKKDIKAHISALDTDELKTLLDRVQKHYPKHYCLLLLLARTGLRIGEALALQWSDIDFNKRFIEVKRSIVRGEISTPKNRKSRRVDMSKQLAATLKEHELASKKKGFVLGLGDLPEFVFTNEKGRAIDKDNWRQRIFYKALKKAGIRRIRIHDLRHTYATLRGSKGDNIADVSNQLGHHSVKLTMDVYYHWIPGAKKSEVDGLDDIEYRSGKKVVNEN